MKIVHINTFECRGGAASAANRLHRGLRAQGQDSSMFVAEGHAHNQNVVVFQPRKDLVGRLRRAVRRRYLQRDLTRITSACRPDSEIFTDDRVTHGGEPLQQLPEGDIFHLHWVAGFVDFRAFLPGAARRAPLVWTLHDMNPFTGGCHYDEHCGRHMVRCGKCPQLASHEESDVSEKIWSRKRDAYSTFGPGRLHVATPSSWMASEAKRSALFRDFPVSVIPNGLDVEVFFPRNRILGREFFGIPNHKLVILCVADWLDNRRKGFDLLRETLSALKDHPELVVATLGQSRTGKELGACHVPLGHVSDDRLMSLAYSMADVFVCPSLQDNLPNTILESMACGVPVVSFSVGGIPEMVREGITGNLVPSGDISGLREAIVRILEEPGRRSVMAANCRRVAVEEYSLEIQARRYINLYEAILGRN